VAPRWNATGALLFTAHHRRSCRVRSPAAGSVRRAWVESSYRPDAVYRVSAQEDRQL